MLALYLCLPIVIYGYSIIRVKEMNTCKYSTAVLQINESWDDGELSWEDVIDDNYGPSEDYVGDRIQFPFDEITDGNCREIKNEQINITVCTIKENNRIKFNIDGNMESVIDNTSHVFSDVMKNPKKVMENFEILFDTNPEFVVAMTVLTTIIKNPPDNESRNRRELFRLVNSAIIIFTLLLKSPKQVS